LRLRWPDVRSSDDEEVFSLDNLQAWQIQNDMLQAFVATDDAEDDMHDHLLERATASGILPHGSMAELAYEHQQANASNLLQRMQSHSEKARVSRWIDLSLPQQGENKPFAVRL